MEIAIVVLFVISMGIAGLAAMTWGSIPAVDKVIALLMVAVFFGVTGFLASLWGSTTVPFLTVRSPALWLKTGAEYRLVGSYPMKEDKYLLIIQTESGSYRTLTATELPPNHFVVGRGEELIALKQ